MLHKQILFNLCHSLKKSLNLTLSNVRHKGSFALAYENFGDPAEVLRKVSIKHDRILKKNDVLVRYHASPINPADINTIQGVYPVKPGSFPAIGGNEGVAEVISVGPDVKNVQVGDMIIPGTVATGTWATHSVLNEKDVIVIDKEVDVLFGAQLSVNPCTAYRMLKDFVKLKEGDSIIQNGGNSAVGLFVIQLAKLWNINTINVVRDRPDLDNLRAYLKSLGATYVLTDEEIRKKEIMDGVLKDIAKPKLALNCVGGQCATDCIRYLENEGTMVTYGGMSKMPVVIPTGSLIFKDHKFVGYWMTRWTKENSSSVTRKNMFKELCTIHKEGKLQAPVTKEISMDDFKVAVSSILKGFTNVKYVIRF